MKIRQTNSVLCPSLSPVVWRFQISLPLLLLSVFFFSLLMGCKKNDKSFAFLEEEPAIAAGEVSIVNYTPETDPVVLVAGKSTTFAVTLGATAGDEVQYSWLLDDSEIASTSNSFLVLSGDSVGTGSHTLKVLADNGAYSDSKEFQLRKNTPPSVGSSSPGATGNSVNANNSITFSLVAQDEDNDSLSFTWFYNGAQVSELFSVTNEGSQSTAIFTPGDSQVGSGIVTVEIFDGYDISSYSWGLDVVNPIVAAINSFSPTASPVVITATGSVDFSISATAKTPTTFTWTLDGVVIPGMTSALYTQTGAGLTVGNHSLVAKVEDSDSSDSHTFLIKRNAPPVLSNPQAAPLSQAINYKSQMTLSIDGTDANSDAINYTWTLDGGSSGTLSASNTATGSQVIFQPNSSLTGNHTILVSGSDGTEVSTHSWDIVVNRFSDDCNQLGAGKICTLVGVPSVGSGLVPSDDQAEQKIQPRGVIDDGSGNWIYSDSHNHGVWFFNRSGSDIVRLGKTIPAGKTIMVVGNGAPGRTNEFDTYNSYKLYNPYGLAYDSVGDRLFVADYSNHRVVMIDNSGMGKRILGTQGTGQGGVTNAEDTLGTTHVCGNPRALTYIAPQLFVTCSNSHSIKMVNPDTGLARVVVGLVNGSGSTSAGTGDGSAGTGAGTSKVSGPQGIAKDSAGNIYWTEQNGNNCRFRVWNRTGSPLSLFNGTVSVPVGQTASIAGSTSQCNYVEGGRTSVRLGQVFGLAVHEVSGVLQGFFLPSYNYHRVMYLNNLNSSQILGGTTVNSLSGATVFGTGTALYNGDNGLGNITRIGYPFDMTMIADGTGVLLSDYYNNRVRRMSLSTGLVSTDVGLGRLRNGLVGGADEDATDSVLNLPYDMSIDTSNNMLYFTDSQNYRIRQVNLLTGLVSTILGEGNSGDGNVQNEDPLNVRMRDPRSVIPFGSHLLYSDAASNNCFVRAFNRTNSLATLFGVSINPMKVSTVAGNFFAGCATFSGSGGAATNASLRNPEGIATDGTNLFIADSIDDCILKVDSGGLISSYIGTCGVGGYAEGPISSAVLNDPTSILFDPAYPGTGNMFFTDQTNSGTARIRYANFSGSAVNIAGSNVNPNSVNTIFAEAGTPRFYGLAAFGNQLCYSSGHTNGVNGWHNVTCRDRSSGLAPVTLRVGSNQGDLMSSGGPLNFEQEGIDALQSLLNKPGGMGFDSQGDLYILERNNSLIRKVKRWY